MFRARWWGVYLLVMLSFSPAAAQDKSLIWSWSPDSQTLAVRQNDKMLLYDVNNLSQPRFMFDSRRWLGWDINGELRFIDSANRDAYTGLSIPPEHGQRIFSPSGQIEVVRDYDDEGKVIISLVKTTGMFPFFPIPDKFKFHDIKFSPDERRALLTIQAELAENERDYAIYTVFLWDAEMGSFITPILKDAIIYATPDVRFYEDGQLAVVNPLNRRFWDGSILGMDAIPIVMWDTENNTELFTSFANIPQALAVNGNGNRFVFLNPSLDSLSVWSQTIYLGLSHLSRGAGV